METEKRWRVVVHYDDPRGGIWRGPLEDRAAAESRALVEAKRVRGSVNIEKIV